MEYIFSITGSGARVVRDAITQKLWPGPGQETVRSQQHHGGTRHDSNTVPFKTGQSYIEHVVNYPEKAPPQAGRSVSAKLPVKKVEYIVSSFRT